MDSLKIRIRDDMKTAMKVKDKGRLNVIRMMLAGIKQIEVDQRIELDDQGIIPILDSLLKQRRESVKQYDKAGRTDLSEIEAAEILVIQEFLPQALTTEEIQVIIDRAIADVSAKSMKDMGKVMGLIKPQLLGRADMSVVSTITKNKLVS